MLEKSSTVVLTEQDLADYRLGIVSERVKQTWGFTLDQLREVVENNNYVVN